MIYKVGDRIIIDNLRLYPDLMRLQDQDGFVTIGGVSDCDKSLKDQCLTCKKYCYQIVGGPHRIESDGGYCEGILHANSRLYKIGYKKPKGFKFNRISETKVIQI